MFGAIRQWRAVPTPLDGLGNCPEVFFAEGDCEGHLRLVVLRVGTDGGFLVDFDHAFMCLAVDELTYSCMGGAPEWIGPASFLREAVGSPLVDRLTKDHPHPPSDPRHVLLAGGNMCCEVVSDGLPRITAMPGRSSRMAFPTRLRTEGDRRIPRQ